MSFCDQCGAQNSAQTRFCVQCGHQLASVGPPLTATQQQPVITTAPASQSFNPALQSQAVGSNQLPAWLASDWPIVLVNAMVIIVGSVAVYAVFGALLGLVSTGSPKGILPGLLHGVFLIFSMLGAKTGVASINKDASILTFTSFLALPGALVPAVAAIWVTRTSLPRLHPDRASLLAYVVKLAVITASVIAIVGSLLSIGKWSQLADSSTGSSDFVAKISPGTAWFVAFLIVGIASFVVLVRAGRVQLSGSAARYLTPIGRSLSLGAQAFALVTVTLGIIVGALGIVVADSLQERLTLLVALPLIIVNLGTAAAVVAMGGSVAVLSPSDSSSFGFGHETAFTHISLMKFGFPPTSDTGSAMVLWFILLVAAPLAVAWLVTRRLDSGAAGPVPTEQRLLGLGLQAGLGFAFVAWIAAFVGRIEIAGFTEKIGADVGGKVALLHPSLSAAFGLGLLWGLVGAIGAVIFWGQRHGVAWSFLQHPTAVTPSAGTPPTAAPGTSAPTFAPPPQQTFTPPPQQTFTPPPQQTFTPPPQPAAQAPPPAESGSAWWEDSGGQSAAPTSDMPTTSPQGVACSNCGSALTPGAAFCTSCGTRV